MIAIQGYFEGDRFIPNEGIPIPHHRKAIVTILDDSIDLAQEKEKSAWRKFLSVVNTSDEEVIGEPERMRLNREIDG
jgi:hypothetical protein